MASAFAHTAASLAISACFYRSETPKSIWGLGAVYSVLPDIDVVGFRLGIAYNALAGHRGLTHSLPFAAALAGVTLLGCFRRSAPGFRPWSLWLYLFLSTASHGVLDAATNGGLGVAFLAPFDDTRYFFPLHPIEVSPIGIVRFFTRRGLTVITSELKWVFLPSAMLAAAVLGARRIRDRRREARGVSGGGWGE